jgi:hypothetical protein
LTLGRSAATLAGADADKDRPRGVEAADAPSLAANRGRSMGVERVVGVRSTSREVAFDPADEAPAVPTFAGV